MYLFFESISAIHRLTMELDRHANAFQCQRCLKTNQFVSHGFIYKKQHQGKREVVGKRLFCSNRYGRSGCGATLRLYPTHRIPGLQYSTHHWDSFLSSLINGATVQKAYAAATQAADPRNAFRWLHKLQAKLVDYRRYLPRIPEAVTKIFTSRTQRLRRLLSTLQQMFTQTRTRSCAHYQLTHQAPFV